MILTLITGVLWIIVRYCAHVTVIEQKKLIEEDFPEAQAPVEVHNPRNNRDLSINPIYLNRRALAE